MAITFSSQIQSLYAGSVATEAAYQAPGTYDLPVATIGGAVESVTITNNGSGYTSVPTVGFTGDGSGAAGTAVLTATTVASITVTGNGTGYTSIPTVTLSGGGGTGATATARMRAATVAIQAGGSGYAQSDTITLTGGTSSQAVILTVATVDGGGAVTSVTISNAGNYSALPSNPVSQGSSSGGGTGATFNITAWQVVAITVGAAGSGYTGVPTVSFSTAGASAAATATAVLTATTVASITITAGGSGYTTAPTVGFTGGAGSNAAGTAVMANVEESKLLTMVEVVRSYLASTGSAAEAKTFNDLMLRMLSAVKAGGAEFDASAMATKAQARAMRLFAKQNRADF